MDEQFYQSQRLDAEALKKLIQRRNQPSLSRWILQYALLIASATSLILGANSLPGYAIVIAMLVYAAMVMAMFAVSHESLHESAFASKSLNRLILSLSCFPIYYTPTWFREFHFEHHRHTHDPHRDPEISIAGQAMPAPTSSLWFYMSYMSGIPLIMYKVGVLLFASVGRPTKLWERFLYYVPVEARARMIQEARLIVFFHVSCIVLAYYLPGFLWVFAAQILGHALLTITLVPEHNGLAHEGLMTERTRTTKTTRLMRWIMWNMPYHLEHHAYPAIPWHALPQAFELLKDEGLHTQQGYLAFHGRILNRLIKGQRFEESKVKTGDSIHEFQ